LARQSTHDLTTDYRRIDVRYLARNGMLSPGYRGNLLWHRNGTETGRIGVEAEDGRVSFDYRVRNAGDPDWQDRRIDVRLEPTGCNYGGARTWFLCPNCGTRRAVLYLGFGPLCRDCRRLSYPSQRMQPLDRYLERGHVIRERLGGPDGFGNLLPRRPKGMHRRTYNELIDELERLEVVFDAVVAGLSVST
jgi:hypothetical protein